LLYYVVEHLFCMIGSVFSQFTIPNEGVFLYYFSPFVNSCSYSLESQATKPFFFVFKVRKLSYPQWDAGCPFGTTPSDSIGILLRNADADDRYCSDSADRQPSGGDKRIRTW
jgi:hypothetical protein